MAPSDAAAARFERVAQALGVTPVTKPAHPLNPQRMNATTFTVRNKMFAWLDKQTLVLKLPPARVQELVAKRECAPHAVGGKTMKEYVEVTGTSDKAWAKLARESLAYVRDKR
jgi:hypothetical protein